MKMTFLYMMFLLSAEQLHSMEVLIASQEYPPKLLELYTSEGCSSCPPAEAWLQKLKSNPQLWKAVVPVAFHVDYWDGLGWPDRFAQATFTARQRQYAAKWQSPSVYTPEFVLDGVEWQGRSMEDLLQKSGEVTKIQLRASVGVTKNVRAFVEGLKPGQSAQLHVAWLGFDLRSEVKAGENNGRNLAHDFLALDWQNQSFSVDTSGKSTGLDFDFHPHGEDHPGALALWLTDTEGKILQVAGGWI